MFPGVANSTEFKKVSELWENEKKYRVWIISFIVSLFVLFSLYLSVTIICYVYSDFMITYFIKIKIKDPKIFFRQNTIILIFMTIFLFLSLIYFTYSVFNSYKIKSFEKLDTISSFFLGFVSFFSFSNLVQQFIYGFNLISGNWIMVLVFILPFLIIPVWLLVSREIKKIKRLFFIAKRQEELNAFYEANGGQYGANQVAPNQFPFGFPFQQNQNTKPVNSKNTIDATSSQEFEKKAQRQTKLQLMTVSQLRKLADKLSISGNKDMKKPELINIILMVSQSFKTTPEASEAPKESDEDQNLN